MNSQFRDYAETLLFFMSQNAREFEGQQDQLEKRTDSVNADIASYIPLIQEYNAKGEPVPADLSDVYDARLAELAEIQAIQLCYSKSEALKPRLERLIQALKVREDCLLNQSLGKTCRRGSDSMATGGNHCPPQEAHVDSLEFSVNRPIEAITPAEAITVERSELEVDKGVPSWLERTLLMLRVFNDRKFTRKEAATLFEQTFGRNPGQFCSTWQCLSCRTEYIRRHPISEYEGATRTGKAGRPPTFCFSLI